CRAERPGGGRRTRRRRSSRPPDPLDELAEALPGCTREHWVEGSRPLEEPGIGTRAGDQAPVARKAGVAQVAGTRLAQARELALTAHAQVELGEIEAARVLAERLQA